MKKYTFLYATSPLPGEGSARFWALVGLDTHVDMEVGWTVPVNYVRGEEEATEMSAENPPWDSSVAGCADGGGANEGRYGQTIGNDGTAKLWELRYRSL